MSILQFIRFAERDVQLIAAEMFVHEILVEFIMDVIMVYAFAGNYDFMIIHGLLGIGARVAYAKKTYPRKVAYISRICGELIQEAYARYGRLSHISKQTRPMSKFLIEVNDLDKHMRIFLDDVSARILGVARMGLVLVFYCYMQSDWPLLMGVSVVYFIITQFGVNATYQTRFDGIIRATRKQIKRLQLRLSIASNQFDLSELSAKNVVQIRTEISDANATISRYTYYTQCVQQLLNHSSVVIMYVALWINANVRYYLRFQAMHQLLTSAALSVISIQTNIAAAQHAYDSYCAFFADSDAVEPLPQLDYDLSLALVSCDVRIAGFNLMYSSGTPIALAPGTRIRVFGQNGEGKSTLLQALNGQIPGVVFNAGIPLNYNNTTCMIIQKINTLYDGSVLHIRDYFKDEPRDEIIEQYMRAVYNTRTYTKIMTMYAPRPYDTDLSDKLSQGEKMLLIIAAKCYEIEKYDKRIIILDEIDAPLDRDNVKRIMHYIFTKFAHCVIIAATHVCGARSFRLKWTTHLRVHDHMIQQVVYKGVK
jgi:ABC-type transport system involved in cytochrome bd biosynthesis fused ATPase/permease subunit